MKDQPMIKKLESEDDQLVTEKFERQTYHLNGFTIEENKPGRLEFMIRYNAITVAFTPPFEYFDEKERKNFAIRQGYIYLKSLLDDYVADACNLGVIINDKNN